MAVNERGNSTDEDDAIDAGVSQDLTDPDAGPPFIDWMAVYQGEKNTRVSPTRIITEGHYIKDISSWPRHEDLAETS
jgi:hypothetical protein